MQRPTGCGKLRRLYRKQGLTIDANGVLSVDGMNGPPVRFEANGDILVNGERVANMALDGVLQLENGTILATVDPDGATEVDGRAISFGPDGALVGGNPSGPRITLAPADSPAKRLAMTAFLMMFMLADVATKTTPTGAQPPLRGD